MAQLTGFRTELFKILLYSLLSFFLLPALGYVFVHHATATWDAKFLAAISQNIEGNTSLSSEQKEESKRFFAANPPSAVCSATEPDLQSYREKVCAPYSDFWQFHVAWQVSWWALVFGAGVLAAIVGLGALAYAFPHTAALNFLFGWRLLILATVAEVIVQGGLAVWLSYWVTAFYAQVYYPKLILIVGITVVGFVAYAIIWIFKNVPLENALEGEVLTEEAEPRLWERVRALAKKAGTEPPDHIVAGIETNFFVTQAPLTVNGQELTGRILYVSLPLLRVFSRGEADAVLAHEFAHFRGGDTKWSALLGLRLRKFDVYCHMMHQKSVIIAVHILRLYRVIFELALKRGSRLREYIADRAAAAATSAKALVHALIKFSAYASYRNEIEGQLFSQRQLLTDKLSIGDQVAAGLSPYATSNQFLENMRLTEVPHPFDSHPDLRERMKNVGYVVGEDAYAGIVTAASEDSWAADIAAASEIEAKLWSKYEDYFKAEHEKNLAYRYEPANAEEEEVVVRYFPPVFFDLKGGKRIGLTYAGLVLPKDNDRAQDGILSWDQVEKLNIEETTFFGLQLIITHPGSGGMFAPTSKVSLAGIGKQKDLFLQLLESYWNRHRIMRQLTETGA